MFCIDSEVIAFMFNNGQLPALTRLPIDMSTVNQGYFGQIMIF